MRLATVSYTHLKYLRAHAEMQNIQRRANEERQQLQKYRSQDLAKAILPSLDNLERAPI